MAENGGERTELTRLTRRDRNRMRRVFESTLAAEAERGHTDPSRVSSRAAMLVATVLGISVAGRGGASTKEVSQMIEGVRDIVRLWRA
ncbi:MAG: hypothetical protein AAF449_20590, partial [Myxococcota bacterium]